MSQPAAQVETKTIISATDVGRVYGEGAAAVTALDGVSVEFPSGGLTAIMGPSGSGKSTLMHCLAGLDRPTSGTVVIDGVDLADLDDAELTELRRDNVGFVFQFFNLLPVLDARENILLPLKLAGRDPDQALFDRLVAAIGISDRLDHRPAELSGGQQQRVAIARALMSEPAVVFADEPTGNLDSHASEEVLGLLRTRGRRARPDGGHGHPRGRGRRGRRPGAGPGRRPHRPRRSLRERGADPRSDEAGRLMGAIALRNLSERKLRTVLTSLAIVLGVMMVAGTYVLTDTIDRSFDRIFTQSNEGVDAVVSSKQAIETFDDSAPAFPEGVLKQVRAVDGVEYAEGSIADQQLSIIGSDGKPRGGNGAPSLGFSVAVPYSDRFDPLTYEQGGPPRNNDEVVIDKASADDEGFAVGDQVTLAGRGGTATFTLSGIATLGDAESLGGATFSVLTLPEAQKLTGKEGKLDQVEVAADPDTSPEQLAANLKAALPGDFDVKTGAQETQSQRDDISEFTSFIKTALLIFAGVALFVGSFLIFNTFSITVAQRTREFAMLRTLGASRRQILASVVLEAGLIGLVASIVGVAIGIGFAKVIKDLLSALGLDLPATGTVVEPRTIIVGLLLGTVITVLSALMPARRATRVAPVAGLRDGVVASTTGERRRRTATGVVLAILGGVAMALGLFGVLDPGEAWVGVGAVGVFLGVALLSPVLVTPLASVVGAPIGRFGGVPGTLARENSVRNPGRTASTAAALMVGLALVSFVAVFAAGIKGSIDDAIDKTLTADLTISNEDGFSDIPIGVRDAAAGVDGVAVASPLRFTQDEVDGKDGTLTLVDPATAADVLALDWDDGSDELLTNLGPDQAVADEGFASDRGLAVGDSFDAKTVSGKVLTLTVVGTFTDNADFIGDYAASDVNADAFDEQKNATNVFIKLDPGADLDQVRSQLDSVMEQRFPTVKVEDQQELKDSISKQVDQTVGIIYALLLLSVIVSVFGIVNTLALTIHERTRELGLLRAVGMSRRQVRRSVRYEAVITALIGAALGLVLGVLFAVLVSRPLADEGFTLSIPIGTLIGLMVLAALAGVLAAIGPARRASRLDVLEALAYE